MIPLSKFLAAFKIRLDLGGIFLTIINFALLIIATSSKFVSFFHFNFANAEIIFTIIAVPIGFLFMITIGQILLWIKYLERYSDEQNSRNPAYTKIFKDLEEIKERLNENKR